MFLYSLQSIKFRHFRSIERQAFPRNDQFRLWKGHGLVAEVFRMY